MAGYISESIRHYRVAEKIHKNINIPSSIAYAVVSQLAFYIEAVLNDVIFSWHFNRKHAFPNFELHKDLRYCNQYNERISINEKLLRIIHPKTDLPNNNEIEYIEFKHLILIRNNLVHLKPTEQQKGGKADHKGPIKALNYLVQKKIVNNPFEQGVFWADVIDHNVSDWSFKVVNNLILFMFKKTFYEPFGIDVLDWQCLQLGIGRYKKIK